MSAQERGVLGRYDMWKPVLANKASKESLFTPTCTGCDCVACGPSNCVACGAACGDDEG